jgi:hypothetical protein
MRGAAFSSRPSSSTSDNGLERNIASAIQHLNCSIEKLVVEIFNTAASLGIVLRPHTSFTIPLDNASSLFHLFAGASDQRTRVAEAIIHDQVCSVVYKHYFEGSFFMGVGSASLSNNLERMYDILRMDGKCLIIYSASSHYNLCFVLPLSSMFLLSSLIFRMQKMRILWP